MIRRMMSLLLVAVFGMTLGLAGAAAPPRPADDEENLICFGDAGPIVLRLHLLIDGRSHRARWNEMIDRIFTYADRDRDGILSPAEVKALPPTSVLASVLSFGGEKGAAPKGVKMTRRDVADHYRRTGLPPLLLRHRARSTSMVFNESATPPSPDRVNARLFELLDTDGDGVLSRRELEAAPRVLRRLDVDEDEMITTNELLGKGGRTSADDDTLGVALGAGTDSAAGDEKPLHLAAEGPVDKILGQRLLLYYGRKGAKSLDAKALGLSAGLFARLDRNRDGRLDADELSRFAALATPELELTVRVAKSQESTVAGGVPLPPDEPPVQKMFAKFRSLFTSEDRRPPFHLHASGRRLPEGVTVAKDGKGVTLERGKARVELRTGGNNDMDFRIDIKSQYKSLFQMADADNNGYLDKTEAAKNPIFRGPFEAMDADGDGKVFEKEMLAYLDVMASLRATVARSCLTVSVSDKGSNLFTSVDLDNDGRLSVRELRQMAKLLDKFDANKDGKLMRFEVPRRYHATFERGAGSGLGLYGAVSYSTMSDGGRPTPAKGPLWFRKMDRNRDGDVSRKEWLGADEDFKAIDADGDGLISLAEAEAYDRKKRARK